MSPGPAGRTADRAGPGLPGKERSALELLPEYREWLNRLDMTYESVVNCCVSRLRDRSLGEAAGLTILTGLLSRPKVFQYFGLPYSGRIAHLAEPEIARLKGLGPSSPAGAQAGRRRWHQIRERLDSVPARQQAVLVRACVDGYSGK
jgi:hypothetical protein